MATHLLSDPEIWKNAWKHDPEAGVNRMKRAGMNPLHSFDSYKTAKSFHDQAFSEEGRNRAARIMGWIQSQGVHFDQISVLDIGAASGGFSIPFAQQGARVTALEPSKTLTELMKNSVPPSLKGSINIVQDPFENVNVDEKGWKEKFDLVFASMCPAIFGWEMVEKALSCASQFCYISTIAGPKEHNLIQELRPVLGVEEEQAQTSDMFYIMQLLNIYGYSFQTLITRETQVAVMSLDDAVKNTLGWFEFCGMPTDRESLLKAEEYLRKTYAGKKIEVRQGGRFGKVLIRLKDQSMG
ncbi:MULTISPECIES: class I SAM-dependent methyltransferase [Paenibacillus]|uniref:Methyltransferase domain-containing protein n=1 Tax=Paenibacillus albilobatus TaxID=2716884 RepID=A0A919XHA3_9BACL|nr:MULTISPECIES: class I SAM-dependent methyltransferase [Paenibacillus]GIO30930.1 hypothetical protein J2TS6_20710 [Paenibacillus albilobatus]